MQLKRILVALAGSSADPDVIRLVAWIAKPAKAQVVGIHVIEVRWNLPLDAGMEQELDRGEELLVSAKKVADPTGIELETALLQARDDSRRRHGSRGSAPGGHRASRRAARANRR